MEQAREPDSLQSTAQASAATEFMHSLLRLLLQHLLLVLLLQKKKPTLQLT